MRRRPRMAKGRRLNMAKDTAPERSVVQRRWRRWRLPIIGKGDRVASPLVLVGQRVRRLRLHVQARRKQPGHWRRVPRWPTPSEAGESGTHPQYERLRPLVRRCKPRSPVNVLQTTPAKQKLQAKALRVQTPKALQTTHANKNGYGDEDETYSMGYRMCYLLWCCR